MGVCHCASMQTRIDIVRGMVLPATGQIGDRFGHPENRFAINALNWMARRFLAREQDGAYSLKWIPRGAARLHRQWGAPLSRGRQAPASRCPAQSRGPRLKRLGGPPDGSVRGHGVCPTTGSHRTPAGFAAEPRARGYGPCGVRRENTGGARKHGRTQRRTSSSGGARPRETGCDATVPSVPATAGGRLSQTRAEGLFP